MPLPSSGQISLDQMHVEAGGTSGTQCSIQDSDIRALIGIGPPPASLSFNQWYGASAITNVHSSTMTVGTLDLTASYAGVNYGFNDMSGSGLFSNDFGSLTNSSFTVGTNSSVELLRWNTVTQNIMFRVGSTFALSNSGWSTLQIGSTSFSRSAATFSSVSLTSSFDHNFAAQWVWSSVSTNPIGTSGTKSITVS